MTNQPAESINMGRCWEFHAHDGTEGPCVWTYAQPARDPRLAAANEYLAMMAEIDANDAAQLAEDWQRKYELGEEENVRLLQAQLRQMEKIEQLEAANDALRAAALDALVCMEEAWPDRPATIALRAALRGQP